MIASERDADVRIGYELQGLGGHGGERWMDATTGEAEGTVLRVAFDRRLKLEFHGASVTTHRVVRQSMSQRGMRQSSP